MVHFLIVFLEAVFFIGLAGSMVVAIMAFVGDFTDFFERDKPEGAVTRSHPLRRPARSPQRSPARA